MGIEEFYRPLIGGCLIGLGSLFGMAASGKIPGISGIVSKVIRPKSGDTLWRVIFLLGLIVGALVIFTFLPETRNYTIPGGRGLIIISVAAFLVGFGARMGGGCTSGHGVCGIGAGARDGIIYTCVFMLAGAMTVFIWNLVSKGAVSL